MSVCILYVVNLIIMNLFIILVVDSCGKCSQDIEVYDNNTE